MGEEVDGERGNLKVGAGQVHALIILQSVATPNFIVCFFCMTFDFLVIRRSNIKVDIAISSYSDYI